MAAGATAVGIGAVANPAGAQDATDAAKAALLPFYFGAQGVQEIASSVAGHIFDGSSSEVTAAEVNETAVKQSTWEIATGLSEGRETFIEEIRHEFGIGESVDTLQTSHGAAMWSGVETSIARSRIDGDTQAAAVADARDYLNEYAAKAVWNNLDRWNSFWVGASTAVAKSITGEGVVTPAGGSFTALEDSSQTAIDATAVDPVVENGGKTYVWGDRLDGPNVDLPNWLDLTAVTDNDDGVEASDLYITRYVADGSVVDVLDPTATGQIEAEHPDYGTQTLADADLYAELVDITRTLRNDLSAEMTSTVDSIYQQFEIGQKSPSDIISSQEMLQEFGAGDGQLSEQSAVAALTARGYAMPSDMETRVTVNHPDLEGETTGWLFIDTPSDIGVSSGMTISANEYKTAYVVFESAVDGTTQTQMLSGTEDLQIVEYSGSTRHEVPVEAHGYLNEYHDVYLMEDHESLQDGSADRIEIKGGEPDYTIDPSELEEATDRPDAVYQFQRAEPTGAEPHTAEIVDGLTIESRETSYVSDPTAPEATNERVDRMQEAWEEIREQLEGLEGGGSGGGGGGEMGLGALAALVGGGGLVAYILTGGS